MNRPRRSVLTALAGTGAVLAASLALAVPADAHVTVSSAEATQGGYAVVAVRVPTESATASTVKVQLQLPTATPFASVGVEPTPGWTDTTSTTKLAKPVTNDDGDSITTAVSEVTWTAQPGSAIEPGHFQQFFIQVGPLPKVPSVTFKAIQTYSDGSVVKWIETPAPGSTEAPAHPAPTLKLAAAQASGTAAAGSNASAGTGSSGQAAPASTSSTSGDTAAVVLSIIALVVAAGALGFGLVSRARGRKDAA